MSKLTCRNVHTKYFGYEESICGFSADFSDGFNVVFGAEKSGKTTLLKSLAGLISSEGDILLDDTDVRTLSLKDRDFAFVFDDLALFSRRSVLYNLEYPLKLRKVPKAERRHLAREAAALFDLEVMIECPVYKLNAWHRVALALCRAYLRKAAVTFIDNVFACLDVCTRKEAFYRFMPLFADRGILIYATDLASEAAFLSNDIYYLNYGYLLQRGSFSDLRERPSCCAAFEAFNDCVTLLPAMITAEGLKVFDSVVPFDSSRLIGEQYVGNDVYLGLRPVDISLSENGISATIKNKFYSEKGHIYSATCFGVDLHLLDGRDLAPNSDVHFIINNVFALFDRNNERAIMRY